MLFSIRNAETRAWQYGSRAQSTRLKQTRCAAPAWNCYARRAILIWREADRIVFWINPQRDLLRSRLFCFVALTRVRAIRAQVDDDGSVRRFLDALGGIDPEAVDGAVIAVRSPIFEEILVLIAARGLPNLIRLLQISSRHRVHEMIDDAAFLVEAQIPRPIPQKYERQDDSRYGRDDVTANFGRRMLVGRIEKSHAVSFWKQLQLP